MHVTIVFDSRGGTTHAASQRMAELLALRDHRCEVVAVQAADPAEVARADLLCLGSWTRGLMIAGQHPTPSMMRFIDRLGELDDKPMVVFCTYKLAPGSTVATMADAVESAGARVLGRFAFRGREPDERFIALAKRLPAAVADPQPQVVNEPRSHLAALHAALMRTTDLTHAFQGKSLATLLGFYGLWARFYDSSMKLTPGYLSGLGRMVALTVHGGDNTLDVGCGTGLATLQAARHAQSVVAVDVSTAMMRRLTRKLKQRHLEHVEVLSGPYPEAVAADRRFDSAISSFALVHFSPAARRRAYQRLHAQLEPGGRLGLFAAQGEIASAFETTDELLDELRRAGFDHIVVRNIHDVYRLTSARRPMVSSAQVRASDAIRPPAS